MKLYRKSEIKDKETTAVVLNQEILEVIQEFSVVSIIAITVMHLQQSIKKRYLLLKIS